MSKGVNYNCLAKVWNLCIWRSNIYEGKIWIKDVSYTCMQRLLVRKEQNIKVVLKLLCLKKELLVLFRLIG